MSKIQLLLVDPADVENPPAGKVALVADEATGLPAVLESDGTITSIIGAPGPEGPEGPEGPPSELAVARHGVKAYNSAAVAWADQAVKPLPLNTDVDDTDDYHFTSSSNLTGTVAKTAASPNIVGTGTAFTTELSVNQAIAIAGTATEIGIVKAITDDTHLELWQTMANSATGQTAVRRNDVFAVPAGHGGWYDITAGAYVAGDPAQDAPIYILKNGPGGSGTGGAFPAGGTDAVIIGAQVTPYTAQPSDVGGVGHVHASVGLAEGDYVQAWLYMDNNGGGGSFNVGSASPGLAMWMAMELRAGGVAGPEGPPGADGADGADGLGVPSGGTTGQLLAKASATDNDTEWVDPPSGGGTAELLAIKQYGGGTTAAIASSSLTDIDATNAAVTFTAPANGKVLVKITASGTTSGDINSHLGIREGGSDVGVKLFFMNTQGLRDDCVTVPFYVTGLSAGSHTFKAAAAINSGTLTIRLSTNSPITIEVWSAP